jgi:5'-nucleotidase / UDP-sugar diphosphatase
MYKSIIGVLMLLALLSTCAEQHEYPAIAEGTAVRITFLHTSDIHSRLLPYRMAVTYTDKSQGLLQENEPFGGVARLAHIINRERARGGRVLYVDSGDVFQGAPIFNVFGGEAEFLAMSYLNPDAMVVGNHEFDTGLSNLIDMAKDYISFPFLAANYYFMPDNEMGELTHPYTIVNANGIRIGLIGIGDFGSITSLTDIGNSLKMMPLNNIEVVNNHVNVLRPQVDLLCLVSHAGLSDDQEIAAHTRGIDIIFGGHLHIVLNPPKVVKNLDGEEVLLVHSGAFAKYVGRLDVVTVKGADGRTRVKSHDYTLFPVDSTVPEDPKMAQLMEDYRLKLNQQIDLTSVYGYSPKLLTKYGYEGGDSSLGNLVSEAIRRYARVDIAFTNTLGIRANMYPGPITLDDLFNVFPFENSITLMYMSGTDLRELLNYVAQRSSGRGCVSQLQVAGIEFVMNCNADPPKPYYDCRECEGEGCLVTCVGKCGSDTKCVGGCIESYKECVLTQTGKIEDHFCLESCLPSGDTWFTADMDKEAWDCFRWCFPRAEEIQLTDCPNPMAVDDISTCNKVPLVEHQVYEVATNDYIARGGSGFSMLKSNNTQTDTELPLRDAVLEVILTSDKCLEYCLDRDGDMDLADCSVFQGCIEKVGEFQASFCEKLDKTGGKEIEGQLQGCAVDTGECWYDSHCYHPEFDCAGGQCEYCGSSAECLVNDPDSICVGGFCVKKTHICVEGRCMRSCESDDDCPGMDSLRESQCVLGRCRPAPAVSCAIDIECTSPLPQCFGDSPICNGDEDCDAGFDCRQNMCIPSRKECSKDTDCGGKKCLFGLCTYAEEKVACKSNASCLPEGECKGGFCSFPCGNCQADDDCPGSLECIKNYCVSRFASCDGFRCRTHCVNDGNCKSGEVCVGELCQPAACFEKLTAEEACRMNAIWRAAQKCSNVGCVDSRVDGRIGRILPENLGDLEFGFVPENPEDIDYE